ncbi:MAG: UDP-glucose 4-epimerase GalE [Acidobacteriia bacterium]|nr:UDP-glucose 4-epimerase GalE [Terriglobia bacterium]
MNVLITGIAGYIGSYTAKQCVESGWKVIGVDNFSTGLRTRLRWGECETGDAGDVKLIRRLLRRDEISVVIHLAGSAQVGESLNHPTWYFANNCSVTGRLLQAMRDEGVPNIVFASSCAIYGSPNGGIAREDSCASPLSPYGDSKLFAERHLRWCHHAFGLNWISLRYFNVAGVEPGSELGEDPIHTTRAIPRAISAALKIQGPFPLFGTDHASADGTAVRDYVHVVDVARANVAAARYLTGCNSPSANMVNIGSGRAHSIREILSAVARISGQDVPVLYRGRRVGEPACVVADASRASAVLGWQPRCSSLDDLVQSTFAWQSRLQPVFSNLR